MIGDADEIALTEALRWQRDYVLGAQSPTAAQVLQAVEEDVRDGGELAGVLPRVVRFGDLPGLRVMAAVHLLALQRRAPRVAMRLPTLGGSPPVTSAECSSFRRDVVDLLASHADDLRASMARTPQTNETGRAALLRCALSRIDAPAVRLREIGASAGLNLRADHLPGDAALEAGPLPPILDRVGCDLHPVDVGTTQGRALLSSYVWVDDVERFRRLAAAIDVAARVPATMRRMDASDFVDSLDLAPGSATVLWHSAMWVYLEESTRQGILAGIERLGATASPEASLHHVSWEWDTTGAERSAFELVARQWSGRSDDGVARVLARGRSHGRDVHLISAGP